jgi:hypothetical protein
VIVYSTPSDKEAFKKGVVVLEAPATVKKALLDLNQDVAAGWGDITSLEEGVNVFIDRTGEKLNTTYTVKPHSKRSNIVAFLEQNGMDPKEVLKPYDLDKVYWAQSYDELKGILESSRDSSFTDGLEDTSVSRILEAASEDVGTATPEAPNVNVEIPDIPEIDS